MADEMMPVPVEGWAQESRLGHPSGINEDERLEALLEAQRAVQRRRAVFQIVALSVGALCIMCGITALWGWPWAVLAFGMMSIIMGVLVDVDLSTRGKTRELGR